jgi:DNA adenine methylase
MLTFAGNGKNHTKAALKYFNKRVENGYWDKLEKYNEILSDCKITKSLYEDVEIPDKSIVYVDPPYYKLGDNLYDNTVNHKELHKYLEYLSEEKNCLIILSYNDCEFIRKLYNKNWNTQKLSFTYTTGRKTSSGKCNKVNELVITNYFVIALKTSDDD